MVLVIIGACMCALTLFFGAPLLIAYIGIVLVAVGIIINRDE